MQFTQRLGEYVEVSGPGEARAVYRHGGGGGAGLPKACVHPMVTPGGTTISGYEMSDHVWHRGLWFTIKFVNGSNFWEENAPYGVQASAGEPFVTFEGGGDGFGGAEVGTRVTHHVMWTSEATGDVILERRMMTFRTDGERGVQVVDFTTVLEALVDVELDRTPYTTWGGYGGLSFRGSRELHEAVFLRPGREAVAGIAGERAEWLLMHAKVDGGAGKTISIGAVDHPRNPRSPTPWYCKGANGFTFFNAAFLFAEGMKVAKGQRLRFDYRLFYCDGKVEAEAFGRWAEAFRAEAIEGGENA